MNKHNKKLIATITTLTAVIVVIITSCAIFVNDYYHADNEVIAEFISTSDISTQTLDEHTIIYTPENPQTGFIFYPGGKVEHTAYAPLMHACASNGILCVLVEMPLNLAVLDIDAAKGIQEQFPEIKSWYIGGHSLGGSMAASYLSDYTNSFEGLILLGSYSLADLSTTSLHVLSVYGSEDKVLNSENYVKYKTNLPANLTELVIDGGCHAYFGMYGEQKGDGTPTISNETQIQRTANAIQEFIIKTVLKNVNS